MTLLLAAATVEAVELFSSGFMLSVAAYAASRGKTPTRKRK